MDRNEVMRLAREAGIIKRFFVDEVIATIDSLERFAALVAAAEREECARLCEAVSSYDSYDPGVTFAERIRARGKQEKV